jgi:hypothetical protein
VIRARSGDDIEGRMARDPFAGIAVTDYAADCRGTNSSSAVGPRSCRAVSPRRAARAAAGRGICHGATSAFISMIPVCRSILAGGGVLEGSFSVDLTWVRLHAGPRTDAFLRVHGCARAMIAGPASPTMGMVSADETASLKLASAAGL